MSRSRTPSDLFGLCPACFLRSAACVCKALPTAQTALRIVVLRHASERWSTTNTARLVGLVLPAAEIWDYGQQGAPPLDARALEPLSRGRLLYPAEGALPPPPGPWAPILVVPDGRWQHTRRLVRRHAVLEGMARLSLGARPRPLLNLRGEHAVERRSTLEAISDALALLGEAAASRALREAHAYFLEARARSAQGERDQHGDHGQP